MLHGYFGMNLTSAPAFPMPEHEGAGAEMVRHDLDNTGKKDDHGKVVLEPIKYEDEQGRKADFHALRHTFVSNLVAGGSIQRLPRL